MSTNIRPHPGSHAGAKRRARGLLIGVGVVVAVLSGALVIELWLARVFDDHLIATILVLILGVVGTAFASPIFTPRTR